MSCFSHDVCSRVRTTRNNGVFQFIFRYLVYYCNGHYGSCPRITDFRDTEQLQRFMTVHAWHPQIGYKQAVILVSQIICQLTNGQVTAIFYTNLRIPPLFR